MVDRTHEFHGCLQISRVNLPEKLVTSFVDASALEPGVFSRAASHAAIGLEGTSKLIDKLTRLVSRKGTSNDPTLEINDVSRLFKEDMELIQKELITLQSSVENGSSDYRNIGRGSQHQKHCLFIIESLRKKAREQTKSFQMALQQRTSVLKELNERRKHYSHTRNVGLKINMNSPLFGNDFDTGAQHKNKSSPLSNTRDRIGLGAPLYQPNNSQIVPSSCITATKSPENEVNQSKEPQDENKSTILANRNLPLPVVNSHTNATTASHGNSIGLRRRPGTGTMNMQPVIPGNSLWQVQELQNNSTNRLSEAKKVESMIGELGQMFSKFSALVAQQDELVMHIEDDVEMAYDFASDGQAHLSRYYQTISGNRGIIIKVIILLAFFVWLFTVFL